MRYLLSAFLLVFILSPGAFAQENEKSASGPKAKFEKEVINYGKIEKNANGVRKFEFTNVGSKPLVIKNAKGSCGCTVPKWPRKPIKPGETSAIEVKYATNRVGRFSKSVTLSTNGKPSRKVLRIKGEVLPPPKKEGNLPLKKDQSVVESGDAE